MHENWSTVRRSPIRSHLLLGLFTIMPDLGETGRENWSGR